MTRPRVAALVLVGLFAWFSFAAASKPVSTSEPAYYSDPGERLIHGLPDGGPTPSWHLPLSDVAAALLFEHHPALGTRWRAVFVTAATLLALAVAWLLAPSAGALAAPVLLAAFFLNDPNMYGYTQAFYALLVLLAAGFLVWRAREPSLGRTVGLSLSLGATLLFRSPLALFPPLLAAYELAAVHRGSIRDWWKQAAVLCVVPFLFLLPWIHLNWAAQHRFVPFENGEANANVISAAKGYVFSIDMDSGLAGAVGGKEAAARQDIVLRWAAGEILREPGRYLRGFSRRAAYAASLRPMLLMLALAGFLMERRRREFAELGLLCSYFFFIHCLMALDKVYFVPLWPLLAVAAAVPVARACGLSAAAGKKDPSRAAPFFLTGCLSLVLVLAAETAWITERAAVQAARGRPSKKAALQSALAAAPEDAWLLSARSKERLRKGDLAGAREDLARAAALQPGRDKYRLELAWADALEGRAQTLLDWPELPRGAVGDADGDFKARVLKSVVLLRLGRKGDARQQLEAALPLEKYFDPGAARERKGQGQFSSGGDVFARRSYGVLTESGAPARDGLAFLDLLREMDLASGDAMVERARLAVQTGDRAQAIKDIGQAEDSGLTDEQRRTVAELSIEVKDYRWALGTFEQLTRAPSAGAGAWIDLAGVAAKLGERGRGREALLKAESLGPDEDARFRLALGYQELKDYPAALRVFDGLVRESPSNGEYLGGRGLCRYLSGSPDGALSDLEASVRLAPDSIPTYLTLGAVYVSRKRDDEAVAVYDRALALKIGEDVEGLRRLITESRNEALARSRRVSR